MGKPQLHPTPQSYALTCVALSPIAWFVLPTKRSMLFSQGSSIYSQIMVKSHTLRGLAIRPLEIEDGIPQRRHRGRHLFMVLW